MFAEHPKWSSHQNAFKTLSKVIRMLKTASVFTICNHEHWAWPRQGNTDIELQHLRHLWLTYMRLWKEWFPTGFQLNHSSFPCIGHLQQKSRRWTITIQISFGWTRELYLMRLMSESMQTDTLNISGRIQKGHPLADRCRCTAAQLGELRQPDRCISIWVQYIGYLILDLYLFLNRSHLCRNG